MNYQQLKEDLIQTTSFWEKQRVPGKLIASTTARIGVYRIEITPSFPFQNIAIYNTNCSEELLVNQRVFPSKQPKKQLSNI